MFIKPMGLSFHLHHKNVLRNIVVAKTKSRQHHGSSYKIYCCYLPLLSYRLFLLCSVSFFRANYSLLFTSIIRPYVYSLGRSYNSNHENVAVDLVPGGG